MGIKKHLIPAAILLASIAAHAAATRFAEAGETHLQSIHSNSGVGCKDCHGTDKPERGASSTACLQCHGPYATLAERTRKLDVNPHKSHLGDVDCLKCHGVHAPVDESKVPCLSCHGDFEFKLK